MTATAWRAGSASDCGPARLTNEDRVYVEESRGIFLVADGVGGQSAGEKAAETAIEVIARELARSTRPTEKSLRRAIAAANNEICALGAERAEWRGMACVLTLAVIDGDSVVAGHVGDSRLYLAWNCNLRKITSDHSPVGEREDTGQLTEEQAMRHPGRNQIYREVGAAPHEPDDEDFIEIRRVPFRPDAALLLCTDGLSDALTSSQIGAAIEEYDGDPQRIAQDLIDAAIEAGSRDNVSAVFVPGPDFRGRNAESVRKARARLAATRVRRRRVRTFFGRAMWFLSGLAAGVLAARAWLMPVPQPLAPARPRHFIADADAGGLSRALSTARPGDTIEAPPGEFRAPVVLREDVTLIASSPGESVIRTDPGAAGDDSGIAVVAREIHGGRISGFRIAGREEAPLVTGVLVENSDVTIDDVEISGAADAAVRIKGQSAPRIEGSRIHSNTGAGIVVEAGSSPRVMGNRITGNGTVAGALRGGIETDGLRGTAVIRDNIVEENGRGDTNGDDK